MTLRNFGSKLSHLRKCRIAVELDFVVFGAVFGLPFHGTLLLELHESEGGTDLRMNGRSGGARGS
jgi:hypothetical protein